jgi:hypothetical protein
MRQSYYEQQLGDKNSVINVIEKTKERIDSGPIVIRTSAVFPLPVYWSDFEIHSHMLLYTNILLSSN